MNLIHVYIYMQRKRVVAMSSMSISETSQVTKASPAENFYSFNKTILFGDWCHLGYSYMGLCYKTLYALNENWHF